jgi:hypothetical protein
VYRFAAPLGSRDSSKSEERPGPAGYGRTRGNYVRSNPRSGLDDLPARSWDFLSLPNCAPEVFVHARRHVFVVCIRDVFAYRLRVTGSGHRKCGNAIGRGRICTDATRDFLGRLWDGAFQLSPALDFEIQAVAPMRHEFINLDLINACHCRGLRRSEKVRIAPASRALNTRLQLGQQVLPSPADRL